MLVVGGALFFNMFHNEPFWAEWMLGPLLFYLGGPLAIVGAAIRFFGRTESELGSKNPELLAKGHR
jgi:hypothetical protein